MAGCLMRIRDAPDNPGINDKPDGNKTAPGRIKTTK
jgi:hypothetical protein